MLDEEKRAHHATGVAVGESWALHSGGVYGAEGEGLGGRCICTYAEEWQSLVQEYTREEISHIRMHMYVYGTGLG